MTRIYAILTGSLDELKTVALVQRMRDAFNLTYWTNEKREAYDAANAWLAQHKPPAPRWEPCAGQHVETKDGRWLFTRDSRFVVCEGEHRVRHGSCCDGRVWVDAVGQITACGGKGWERKA